MGDSIDILGFLKEQQNDSVIRRLLDFKGYLDPRSVDFGLNLWTSRLASKNQQTGQQEKQDEAPLPPKNLVSFYAISMTRKEDLFDTNSFEFRDWIKDYKWPQIYEMNSPFSIDKVKACSEGLLLYEPNYESSQGSLDRFLLLQRDGGIEFGLGRETYHYWNDSIIFLFIKIIGRLRQFIAFTNDLYNKFYPENTEEILYIINLRGTENALLGNLAEGWREPGSSSIESYRPICPDEHLQIRRRINPQISGVDFEDIIHRFATRIDNAWGQFEPRCYVHENIDPARPFAYRKK